MKIPHFLLLVVLLSLTACQGSSPASPPAAAVTATPGPPPTATPQPTATPLPGELVQIGTADAAIQTWLQDQAVQAGLVFAQLDPASAAQLSPQARVAVWFFPSPEISSLAQSHPDVQFLGAGGSGIEPAGNLTVIRGDALQVAFASGYLSVLLSQDWRAAGLFPEGHDAEKQAFQNGGGYFCGDCAPGWPLRVTFPRVGAAADLPVFLDQDMAEIFYLAEGAATPEVLGALKGRAVAARTVIAFGAGGVPADMQSQWAGTIGLDLLPALTQAMPELLAGRSAGALDGDIALSNINEDLLPPSKQERLKLLVEELQAGRIQTLSVP